MKTQNNTAKSVSLILVVFSVVMTLIMAITPAVQSHAASVSTSSMTQRIRTTDGRTILRNKINEVETCFQVEGAPNTFNCTTR